MSDLVLDSKSNVNQVLKTPIRLPDNLLTESLVNKLVNAPPSDPLKTSRIATYTEEATSTIRTTCPYCGVGCGVLASVDKEGSVSVAGDPDHPANFGKLCSKGSALAQTLGSDRRITTPYYQNKLASMAQPQLANSDSQTHSAETAAKPTEWDTVLGDIATRLNDTIAN